MRKSVLIYRGLVAPHEGESILRQKLPTLQTMAELGTLAKLAPLPKVETPEGLYLGMTADVVKLRQGPLTVAALGADPPERSTHFHLSLMSFEDGTARQIQVKIPPEQLRAVLDLGKKLNTRSLTLVPGEEVDHGLVWEGLGDLGTTSAAEVDGKAIKGHLPEGDFESALRAYIDDSVNLLTELEFNEERRDQGLPPLNLFWPWGQGVRTPVPNLALRRGEPTRVLSHSLRLQGLSRLAGYRHGDRWSVGRGTTLKWDFLRKELLAANSAILYLDDFESMRVDEKMEEAEWLVREMDDRLLKPLFEEALTTPAKIILLAPNVGSQGLSLTFQTRDANANSTPFDERALEERTLATTDLDAAVDRGLGAS